MLNLFKSYLSNRSQLCCLNGEFSASKSIKYGVPQGSILGQLLFLIYINDLPNCLEFTTTLFADNTNITASGKSISEADLDLHNVREWLSANKLLV